MYYVILEKAKRVQVKPYQRRGKYVIGYQRLDPRQKEMEETFGKPAREIDDHNKIKPGTKLLLERQKLGSDWSHTPPSERLTLRTIKDVEYIDSRTFNVTLDDKKKYLIHLPKSDEEYGWAKKGKSGNYHILQVMLPDEKMTEFNEEIWTEQQKFDVRQRERRKKSKGRIEERIKAGEERRDKFSDIIEKLRTEAKPEDIKALNDFLDEYGSLYAHQVPSDIQKYVGMKESIPEKGKTLYHVTYTDKTDQIKKQGLRVMQTSNWVMQGQGLAGAVPDIRRERYGAGEIYAFDHIHDALRWAAKMDWEFNKKIGSGKISIVKFKSGEGWEEDVSDPLSQAGSAGKWLKKMQHVPAEDIVGSVPFTQDHAKLIAGVTRGDTVVEDKDIFGQQQVSEAFKKPAKTAKDLPYHGTAFIDSVKFRNTIANMEYNGWKIELSEDRKTMTASISHPIFDYMGGTKIVEIYLPEDWDKIEGKSKLFKYKSNDAGPQL